MSKLMKTIMVGTMVVTMCATGVTTFASTTAPEPTAPAGARCNTATKAERLEIKKERLADQVKAGVFTQEEADAIIKSIEENQVNCDGTGTAKIGQKMGAKFGSQGKGMGNGGRGLGMCTNQ